MAKYDIFISHAFEDKTDFVNALATELIKAKLKVWYSGFELKPGDSITSSVNNALRESEFGIAVISPTYLQKQWAMNELNALFSQQSEKNRILIILHNISADEVIARLPILADRYAISSAKSMDYIVKEIFRAIRSEKLPVNKTITPAQKKGEVPDMQNNANDKHNMNSNTNSTNVNINTGNTVFLAVCVVLLILTVAGYFYYTNQDSSLTPEQSHSSNPTFRNHLKPN